MKVDFNKVNESLFQAIERLNNLDVNDTEKANLEIKRSNAMSQASKSLIASVGIQLMAKKAGILQQDNISYLINKED